MTTRLAKAAAKLSRVGSAGAAFGAVMPVLRSVAHAWGVELALAVEMMLGRPQTSYEQRLEAVKGEFKEEAQATTAASAA